MNKITFTCEVLTPVFNAGADGKTAELRAASIKGLMRFWWRAVNCQLQLDSEIVQVKNETKIVIPGMRTVETAIFGGVGENDTEGKRSSFVLRVLPHNMISSSASLVPHRGMPANAFRKNETFSIILQIPDEYQVSIQLHNKQNGEATLVKNYFNTDQLIALFQLVCMLGGVGKRVRRGMGSVKITEIKFDDATIAIAHLTLEGISDQLKVLSPNFKLESHTNSIINTYQGRMEKYPWISKIELGTAQADITKKISQATHDIKQSDPRKYEPSMGHAFKGRFASPVYVSVLDGSVPVITTLNAVPDRDLNLIDLRIQNNFIRTISK
jgi:CRISPR-associated protein Cmr1